MEPNLLLFVLNIKKKKQNYILQESKFIKVQNIQKSDADGYKKKY